MMSGMFGIRRLVGVSGFLVGIGLRPILGDCAPLGLFGWDRALPYFGGLRPFGAFWLG
jgi:hypothetical protein